MNITSVKEAFTIKNLYTARLTRLTGVVYAFSTAIGFGLALTLFAGLREQMSLVNVPKGMQGTPIALIAAGLLAMAFMGFSGVVKL